MRLSILAGRADRVCLPARRISRSRQPNAWNALAMPVPIPGRRTEDVSQHHGSENVRIIARTFELLTTEWYPHELGAGAHAILLPNQPGIAGRRACFSVKASPDHRHSLSEPHKPGWRHRTEKIVITPDALDEATYWPWNSGALHSTWSESPGIRCDGLTRGARPGDLDVVCSRHAESAPDRP
jgi:hypothetical protein